MTLEQQPKRLPIRFPASVKWWQKRFLLERDDSFCKGGCGRSEPEHPLQIHHVDGDRNNNDPANLKLLCASCQMKDQWTRLRESLSAQRNIPVHDVSSLPLCKAQNGKGRTCFYHVKSFHRTNPPFTPTSWAITLRCASMGSCHWKSAYGGPK